jgi:superfamily II DNA or RNA helicase
MKIGPRGYSIIKDDYPPSLVKEIRNELTVKPFVNKDYGPPAVPFPIYCESKRKLYLPRFYGINKIGNTNNTALNNAKEINVTFSKSLRPKQIPIINTYIEEAKKTGGGIISVPCGYGKTVLALKLIAELKVKTLVIVHKEFLLNQWKERINEFLPEAKIGKIQGNVIKTNDKDIVIGMLQSISMKEYKESVFEDFGFVIYDECHHLGAEVFSKALLKTNFKYLLGLSATPKRADGLTKVFEWYLGPIVYSIKKRDDTNVNVKIIDYYEENPSYSKICLNTRQKPNLPIMINNITNYDPRTELIVDEAYKCLLDKRKILILSDRRDHLKSLKHKFDCLTESIWLLMYIKKHKFIFNDTIWKCILSFYCNNTLYTSGFYLGGMKQRDLEQTERCNIILGTFSMASEGFDCKYPLNTIILGSPKSNIEQAVGRILRQEKDKIKKIPLVIDINDQFSVFSKQTIKRIKFYKKNKYDITRYDKELNLLEEMTDKKKKNVCDMDFLED